MNRVSYFLRKHSPTILTIVGAGGVIATSVLAVKATPRAMILLEEAKKEKGEELTAIEAVKAAWKPYVPAVITGATTIACIVGINCLSAKSQASLMSAYALLDNSYKEYRNKVSETYGEEAEINIRDEIIKSKYDANVEIQNGAEWFFDGLSMRYFKSTMDNVLRAETLFLEALHYRGYACANEYYDALGIPRVDWGYNLGWFDFENNDPYNSKELEFKYEDIMIGEEEPTICWVISVNRPPATDYIV